jgi:tetracycline repressor-like protein
MNAFASLLRAAHQLHAFDLRVLNVIRHFLGSTDAPIRRNNVEAAAFVAFQSVRATMLASLLERPPGLAETTLVEELVDLVLRYLVTSDSGVGATPRKLGSPSRKSVRRSRGLPKPVTRK